MSLFIRFRKRLGKVDVDQRQSARQPLPVSDPEDPPDPSTVGDAPDSAEWQRRAEIFEHSYDEVLAATKHHDDKLGRSLTAVAFLTAAGVAIYNTIGKDDPVLFGSENFSIQSFFFIVFVGSVVFAVAASLAGIGPSAHFGRSGGSGPLSSLLFYARIARDKEWKSRLIAPLPELEKMLAENFHHETRDIANRVSYKMGRSREAAAFINLAAISLSLLAVFSLRGFGLGTRWWVAVGLLLTFAVMPILDYLQMRHFGFVPPGPLPTDYWLLTTSCVIAAILLGFARSLAFEWPAVGYTLGLILTSRLALVSRRYQSVLIPLTLVAGGGAIVALLLMRL